jgi:hypothetical protein
MSPNRGHDIGFIPSIAQQLAPLPPLRSSSLPIPRELPTIESSLSMPLSTHSAYAHTHTHTHTHTGSPPSRQSEEHNSDSTHDNHTNIISQSFHATETSVVGVTASRRDSGYSSTKSTKPPKRSSRASSKQSEASTRETSTSASDDTSRRCQRPRVMSVSKVQNPPKLNIEDAIALHERSRRLFPSPSQSPIVGPPTPPAPLQVLHRSMSTPQNISRPPTRKMQLSRAHTYNNNNTLPSRSGIRGLNDLDFGQSEEEIPPAPAIPPTIIHWTSDETRRKEYARIDREGKGIRGIWNRLFTKSSARSKFYKDEEGSDAGSVRRFRLDLPEGEGK